MKLVTNDYGCGTSSSILDYGIKDVVIVSEQNYQHVFEQDDDLLFIGHDFLLYLWDTEEKVKRWQSYSLKHELWIWCFERIDAVMTHWLQKSHYSMFMASKFCSRFLACDEDDCTKYGFDWLPQWASPHFFLKKDVEPKTEKILFSGQAGKPEYKLRNSLLKEITDDPVLSKKIEITNTQRSFSWTEYIDNVLKYQVILNPIGVLKSLNTRAYETLYAGRLLLQQTAGIYPRHTQLLKNCENIIFFESFEDLKNIVKNAKLKPVKFSYYENNSIFSRLKSVGVEIK